MKYIIQILLIFFMVCNAKAQSYIGSTIFDEDKTLVSKEIPINKTAPLLIYSSLFFKNGWIFKEKQYSVSEFGYQKNNNNTFYNLSYESINYENAKIKNYGLTLGYSLPVSNTPFIGIGFGKTDINKEIRYETSFIGMNLGMNLYDYKIIKINIETNYKFYNKIKGIELNNQSIKFNFLINF